MEIVIELDAGQVARLQELMYNCEEYGLDVGYKTGTMKSHDLKNPFSKAAFYMMNSVMKNFREEGRPDKWEPWSTSYRIWRERIKKPKGILKLAASPRKYMRNRTYGLDLIKSISLEDPNDEGIILRAGDNAPYAAVHQFGSDDGTIPARPFLLFQDEDVDNIQTIFQKALVEKIEGK